MKKSLLALSVAVFALSSCSKDSEAPTITINNPINETAYSAGDAVTVQISVSDNEELKQLYVSFHGGDGHTHKKAAAEFDFDWITNLSGTAATVDTTFTLPNDIELGAYHLVAKCTDVEGNEGETFIEVDVQ